MSDANVLMTYGLPSSAVAFGHITDTTQNGRMPGGVAMDATDPAGEHQAQLAGQVDRRGLVDLHTSPMSWIVLGVLVFVYLNAKARRSGRKG